MSHKHGLILYHFHNSLRMSNHSPSGPLPGYHQSTSFLYWFVCLDSSHRGFPDGSDNKESACNAGDPGSILGWGRTPGEGKDYPLQYSCLENSMDREAWWAIVHRVANSWTQLSKFHFHLLICTLDIKIELLSQHLEYIYFRPLWYRFCWNLCKQIKSSRDRVPRKND